MGGAARALGLLLLVRTIGRIDSEIRTEATASGVDGDTVDRGSKN